MTTQSTGHNGPGKFMLTVLSALIVAAVLGGVSLGRVSASQDERLRAIEERIAMERERTESQFANIREALAQLASRQARDTSELRALCIEILREVKK